MIQNRDERTPGEVAVIGGLVLSGVFLDSSPQTNALVGLWRPNQGKKTKERDSGVALVSLCSNNRGGHLTPSTHIVQP